MLHLRTIINDAYPSLHQIPVLQTLAFSQSVVNEAVAKSKYACLLAPNGKTVTRHSFFEYLQYSLRYEFPQKPGPVVRGVPISHSALP